MSDKAVTLRDAFAAYNVQVDLVMKFFTFLQVISLATAGFMWTGAAHQKLQVPVVIAFVLFAAGNGILVWYAYRDGARVSKAICAYVKSHSAEVPSELSPILQVFRNYAGWQLLVIHVFVDTVAIIAIVTAP